MTKNYFGGTKYYFSYKMIQVNFNQLLVVLTSIMKGGW